MPTSWRLRCKRSGRWLQSTPDPVSHLTERRRAAPASDDAARASLQGTRHHPQCDPAQAANLTKAAYQAGKTRIDSLAADAKTSCTAAAKTQFGKI